MHKTCQKFKWKLFLGVNLVGLIALSSVYYVLIKTVPRFKQQVDNYAIAMVAAEFGSNLLAPAQEANILAIAQEMGICESIVIRKMNTVALQKFGYHNAFACWALLGNVIPFSNQPFMYVSEGFLEDLSAEEQRFLIGHELIHIRDRHAMFIALAYWIAVLLLLSLVYIVQRYVRPRLADEPMFLYVLIGVGIYLSLLIPNLVSLAYRRHIEKAADCESFKLLNSHAGCLKMLERWQSDFKMLQHDVFLGLLSDHPSCYDRQCYCLEHQKATKVIK